MTSARASTAAGLCFDATGTLIEMASSVGEVYAEVALEFGVELPAWRLDDAFGRVMSHAPPRGLDGASADARREGEMEWWSERVRQTFQATDSTVRFADFPGFARALFDTYREARRWRSRPGVVLTLDRLNRAGHPMAVVSNFDHRLPDLLKAMELEEFFRICVIPSDVGRRKPDRALFERASAALGRPVRELAYFGDDDLETLESIGALGVRAVDVRSWPSFEAIDEWLASPATLTTS